MAEPIVVLDGHTLNPGDLNWMVFRRLGSLTVYARTADHLVLSRCENVPYVLTNKTPIGRSHLEQLRQIRYIGVLATGVNVVDLDAARQLNMTVTNVPGYSTESVAQHTIALLTTLAGRVSEHITAVREGDWINCDDFSFVTGVTHELAGKTLGIVGMGSIGQRVAQIASAMGMAVIAAESPSGRRPEVTGVDVQWMSLDQLCKTADAVTLHCPLTDQTRRMFDATQLERLKPDAWLINTSRGSLIDEQALAEALREGRLGGAGLDVLVNEPPSPENPLLTAPNCVITPHVAWASRQARQRLMQEAAMNLQAFIQGQPRNVVTGT